MSQESELERADRNIRQAEKHIARQKAIIYRKRHAAQQTALSEQLLQTLETSLGLHRQIRDQLDRKAG